MKNVFPHGVVEICDPQNGSEFKVNDQRLKSFLELVPESETSMGLLDPMYRNTTSFTFYFM